MIFETSITIDPEDEKNEEVVIRAILSQLRKEGKISEKMQAELLQSLSLSESSHALVLVKKSIDARKGKVKFCLRYKIYFGENPESDSCNSFKPKWKQAEAGYKTVIIVGSGPAGLFAALKLLEHGIKPVVLERGPVASRRKIDIANISRTGTVNENSNYCFGEGGAGTFSDGKLYTRSNKRGNIAEVLQTFVYHGANPEILTDSHPHIGTDKLPKIVSNMVSTIEKYGGQVLFDTLVTDFIVDEKNGRKKIAGVKCSERNFFADAVLLAAGHSANDVYDSLGKLDSRSIEPKTFAVGVRVEHPREIIDRIQYHGKNRSGVLPAAEYRLATQVEGRGVYSFCMCPGGNVVPSQSGHGQIVVNGMSCSSRNSAWSNAAIVVEIRPEDCTLLRDDICRKNGTEIAIKKTCGPAETKDMDFSLLELRTMIERLSFEHGGKSQKAPAQRLVDFLSGRDSTSLPKSSYAPGLVPSRLDLWLPDFMVNRLKTAFGQFDSMMHGFICDEAILIAAETRTSTPVRILRDKESFESPVLQGLFPAGEGSGYAGGITSSALDGINAAGKIANRLGKTT